jgi:hypothetical protein
MAEQRERALSETLAVVLIAMLVIIATVLLIASLTGVMNKMLQTPAFIVVKVDNVSTGGEPGHSSLPPAGRCCDLKRHIAKRRCVDHLIFFDKSVKRGFSGRWRSVLQNKKDSMAIWRYNLHLYGRDQLLGFRHDLPHPTRD